MTMSPLVGPQMNPSEAADDPSIRKSDLMSWGKIVAIVAPIVSTLVLATWKLSGDASDIRHSNEAFEEKNRILTARLDKHDDLFEALSKGMSTVKQVDALEARVSRWEDVISAIAKLQAAAEARSQNFIAVTWPQMEQRLDHMERKIDNRR